MTNEHDKGSEQTEAEILAKITRRLDLLPRVTRAAFLLRWLDDLDYEEIAWRLNLSVRQVERRMAAAFIVLTWGRVGSAGAKGGYARKMISQNIAASNASSLKNQLL